LRAAGGGHVGVGGLQHAVVGAGEADGHVMLMHFEGENSSTFRQFTMLLSRGWNQSVRDVASLKTELIKHLFFAFVIGGAFFQKLRFSYPYDQNNVDDFTGVIFFTMMFFWYSNTQSIPNFAAMDQLYRRELAASAYSPLPYWAATIITKILSLILFFTIFFIIWFFMCGFRISLEYFAFAYTLLFIGSLPSLFFSLLFAATSGNAVIAFAIVPPLSLFMGIFFQLFVLRSNK
jgi:ABC-type multidrug transport system permease subunit